VPYEAFLVHFDAYYSRAENKRFHPISGQPLILKRGEVIPEYRLDVSYGPFNYNKGAGHIYTAEATGEFIMKNIQFGTAKGNGILYNVGGSFSAYDASESGVTSYLRLGISGINGLWESISLAGGFICSSCQD
jgi:hypothetical protein